MFKPKTVSQQGELAGIERAGWLGMIANIMPPEIGPTLAAVAQLAQQMTLNLQVAAVCHERMVESSERTAKALEQLIDYVAAAEARAQTEREREAEAIAVERYRARRATKKKTTKKKTTKKGKR